MDKKTQVLALSVCPCQCHDYAANTLQHLVFIFPSNLIILYIYEVINNMELFSIIKLYLLVHKI